MMSLSGVFYLKSWMPPGLICFCLTFGVSIALPALRLCPNWIHCKEFGDKVKIVLITENNNSEVDRLFSKIKTPRPKLRMVVSDTLLIRKFPHTIVPHHVWVDKNKIVRFITDGHNATRENIRSFLDERALRLHFKNDLIDFDPEKSLLQLGSDLISSYSINYSFFLQDWISFQEGSLVLTLTRQIKLQV
jgi:hypothetical protein